MNQINSLLLQSNSSPNAQKYGIDFQAEDFNQEKNRFQETIKSQSTDIKSPPELSHRLRATASSG
jgi:uncharacterized protein YjbK